MRHRVTGSNLYYVDEVDPSVEHQLELEGYTCIRISTVMDPVKAHEHIIL